MEQLTRRLTLLLLPLLFWLLAGTMPVWAQETGTFSGRVVDVARQPVAGASVYVYGSSNIRRPADYISPPTDASGAFQLALPAGHYWTVARQRQKQGKEVYGPLLPGDRHSGAPLEIDIAAGGSLQEEFIIADLKETSQLAVKIDASFLRIEGKLLGKDGEPVTGAYAFARIAQGGRGIPEYVSAWTDDDGGYILFLPAGTYWLGAARVFPPGPESVPTRKETIDKAANNINIVIE